MTDPELTVGVLVDEPACSVCAWCGRELGESDPWCLCSDCANPGGGDA